MPRHSFDSCRWPKRKNFKKQRESATDRDSPSSTDESAVSSSAFRRATRILRNSIGSISTATTSTRELDFTADVPNELFSWIFSNLDSASLCKCRRVCSRWRSVVDQDLVIRQEFGCFKVDRFTVRYLPAKRAYELRWSVYEGRKSKCLVLAQQEVKNHRSFEFNFRQFDIRRLVFKNMPQKSLNDGFVHFLCQQFAACPKFTPKHLTIERTDMSALTSKGLQELFASCGRYLHTVQILSVSGARPDSVTDAHIFQLNPGKLQRISLESIGFGKTFDKPLLQVGDASLRWLSDAGRFPTLALEKCQVTAPMVCLYTQKWLEKGMQAEGLRSHMCSLKQCPAVSNRIFEKECRRRSLDFENARSRRSSNASDSSEVTCYSIHSSENDREFTVALDDGSGACTNVGTLPAIIALPVS